MRTLRVKSAQFVLQDEGEGDPVLLVSDGGVPGRVWHLHQVPALLRAGFRVITFDRDAPPTPESAPGPGPRRGAAELSDLIQQLELAPCRVVGVSHGAEMIQELLLTRPELLSHAVLMATRGRDDLFSEKMADAERDLLAHGTRLPPRYAAWLRAALNLSPSTWQREEEVLDWLDLFEASERAGASSMPTASDEEPGDRLQALGQVRVPTLVMGFEHDLIVRPHLCAEVGAALPRGQYAQIPDCGHYGYLEQPVRVNQTMLTFFRSCT